MKTNQNDCVTTLTKREHMAIEFTKAIIQRSGSSLSGLRHGACQLGIQLADDMTNQLNEEAK